MSSFPKLLAVVFFLLGSGDVHSASFGDRTDGVSVDSSGVSTPSHFELIHSPTRIPPRPDFVVLSEGESEIEEEETDEFGKFLIAPFFCFHCHPFLLRQPSAFSTGSRAWGDADRVDSVMRC